MRLSRLPEWGDPGDISASVTLESIPGLGFFTDLPAALPACLHSAVAIEQRAYPVWEQVAPEPRGWRTRVAPEGTVHVWGFTYKRDSNRPRRPQKASAGGKPAPRRAS